MDLSVTALALTEKDLDFKTALGKSKEVGWEKPCWKKGDFEEGIEDFTKGKEIEGIEFVLAWLKLWRGVKNAVKEAMETILRCSQSQLQRQWNNFVSIVCYMRCLMVTVLPKLLVFLWIMQYLWVLFIFFYLINLITISNLNQILSNS